MTMSLCKNYTVHSVSTNKVLSRSIVVISDEEDGFFEKQMLKGKVTFCSLFVIEHWIFQFKMLISR
jgi:hypothetical protein